ncbi:MAG: DegT/DnrJ/EryC1/StrS family aminotransferase, partial [SAR324 cluster bacterium]|nr:DegT/DnrJ/EryC1/StrS family aminotransferase [SAR324 cluster bacterium]
EERITPRTRAIIPVDIYGLAADMDAIMDIAARHNLFVLEDAAQCVLGYYKGRVVGSIAHASSFSFQSSKHMISGEGGMLTLNDEELADKIRQFNSLGYATVGAGAGKGKIRKETIQDPGYERHASVGWNYRISEICAAVALGQLERLQELVDMRIMVAELYAEAARGCEWLIPQAVPDDYKHSYWTYVLKLDEGFDWHGFRSKYMEFGGDGIYGAWQLTYLEPAFRGLKFDLHQSQEYDFGLCPFAEAVQPKLLQFKTNYMDMEEAARAADALQLTIKHFDV